MRTQLAKETLASLDQGLLLATVLAVALGICIILNTFLMNVSERRRQLAILRAVGATRRQIVRMLLLEGLVLGVLGTVLGCLLGIGGGYLLMRAHHTAVRRHAAARRLRVVSFHPGRRARSHGRRYSRSRSRPAYRANHSD